MARTSRRRRGFPASSLRRKRVWAREHFAFDTTTTAADRTIDLATDFSAEMGTNHLPVGVTIGGIILDFWFENTAARAAFGDALVMGIMCVDEGDAADVDRPTTDPHADWMWYGNFPAQAGTADQTSTWEQMGGPIRIKAQRKCTELGSHLWLAAEPRGLTNYNVEGVASVLLLLP